MLQVLTNVLPSLFCWYLLNTLRCNRRNPFSKFLTICVVLIFLKIIPSEHLAKSSIPTDKYQYLLSKVTLGLDPYLTYLC